MFKISLLGQASLHGYSMVQFCKMCMLHGFDTQCQDLKNISSNMAGWEIPKGHLSGNITKVNAGTCASSGISWLLRLCTDLSIAVHF